MNRRSDTSRLTQEYVGIRNSLSTKLIRDKRLSEAQIRSKRRTCLKFVSSGGKVGVKTHTSGLTGSKSKVETFEVRAVEAQGDGVVEHSGGRPMQGVH
jgi:hypothetical protein